MIKTLCHFIFIFFRYQVNELLKKYVQLPLKPKEAAPRYVIEFDLPKNILQLRKAVVNLANKKELSISNQYVNGEMVVAFKRGIPPFFCS